MNKINSNGIGETEATRASRRVEVETERADRKSAAGQTSAASSSPRVSDEVVVSERAEALKGLAERAGDAPDVRRERVDALRARIESGDYNPSSDTIADAILRDER